MSLASVVTISLFPGERITFENSAPNASISPSSAFCLSTPLAPSTSSEDRSSLLTLITESSLSNTSSTILGIVEEGKA